MNVENLERNAYMILKKTDIDVYDSEAPSNAGYPYIIYDFRKINLGVYSRNDFVLDVDVWDENINYLRVNRIADKIQCLLNDLNNPDEEVLATYYIEDREKVADENKKIKRIKLVFSVQSYFL
ncbi:MAG: hypothetical protein PHC62_03875 [Candidatus Izemoplasmatales bacterium]|nr:hypothetical protein [Candidatus Izemoplasmatales bacterium]